MLYLTEVGGRVVWLRIGGQRFGETPAFVDMLIVNPADKKMAGPDFSEPASSMLNAEFSRARAA